MAFDFLLGLTISDLATSAMFRLILPKIEPARPAPASLPEAGGLAIEDTRELLGWKDGASGLNLGPDEAKLKVPLAGENRGAEGLILPLDEEVECMLKWLDAADWGGFAVKPGDWKGAGGKLLCAGALLPKTNCPGVKLLVGLNLNSAAFALSFDRDGLLPWLVRRD